MDDALHLEVLQKHNRHIRHISGEIAGVLTKLEQAANQPPNVAREESACLHEELAHFQKMFTIEADSFSHRLENYLTEAETLTLSS